MRALAPTMLLALAVVATGIPAAAEHCTTYSSSSPEFTYDASLVGGPTIYQDNEFDPYHVPAIWIYEESNGIDGLQRGDEVVDDTCHGSIDADTVMF